MLGKYGQLNLSLKSWNRISLKRIKSTHRRKVSHRDQPFPKSRSDGTQSYYLTLSQEMAFLKNIKISTILCIKIFFLFKNLNSLEEYINFYSFYQAFQFSVCQYIKFMLLKNKMSTTKTVNRGNFRTEGVTLGHSLYNSQKMPSVLNWRTTTVTWPAGMSCYLVTIICNSNCTDV